ncbi:MAG: tRNA lysidine(34) synthetase TilS, partial [Candidatus Hydrogenedentes bacterium]|nr:tRNA lysidine(34) synthetase TilS [Candidatus Hydrogenedentota bacterium]
MPEAEHELIERVRATIARYHMLAPGARVMAAVSGGPDSVCLLHVLRRLGYAVEVAHFDHQTRAGESMADAEAVAALAEGLAVPCHRETRPVEAEAAASALSFEDYARTVRYAWLIRITRERGCEALATGHHAGDQAETVLMRLLRGTGPQGLAGIPAVREEDGVRIVRPLLAIGREEVLAFLDEGALAYRTDRTNADTRHLRNRIRHELIPELAAHYNPQVCDALTRLAESQRVEGDFLREAAAAFLAECLVPGGAIARAPFRLGHPALQRRAVQALARRHGVECPAERLIDAAGFIQHGQTGQAFDLGGGVILRNTRDTAEIGPEDAAPDEDPVPLAVPGETAAFGRTFRTRILDAPPGGPLAAYCSPGRQVFDLDALGTGLVVRRRQPGDRFTPLGLSGSKKLKDYFI